MSKQEDFTTSGNVTEYEVHPLFAIPIFSIDQLLDKDVPILRSIQEIPLDDGSYDYGFKSQNTYILKKLVMVVQGL